MNLQGIKDKAITYLQGGSEIEETPAILFIQNDTSKFGDIYLFGKFGFANSNNIQLKSNITNHYTEANYSIQDHWAIEPMTYSLSGFIGEVVYTPPKNWSNFVEEKVTNFLTPLTSISPTVNNYVQSAINVVQQVEATAQRYGQIAQQIYRQFGTDLTRQVSNQEFMFKQMQNLINNRQLVSIYTPYGEFNNMAITSVNMRQQDTKYQSDIEINLQEWRDVLTYVRQATDVEIERNKTYEMQQKEIKDNGVAKGTNGNNGALKSYLYRMLYENYNIFANMKGL